MSFASTWTQFFPPNPKFTDEDVPNDLAGKVYIVTGANSGMGKGVAQVLYNKGAKVYVACRSEEKALKTIETLKSAAPKAQGSLAPLHLELSDLEQVKTAAHRFLSQESKLHVLFNNAGVMVGPSNPIQRTKQGHELALGVNCVATFLFTELLTPTLVATAKQEPANTVRVVWLSSFGLQQFAPPERGIDMTNLDYKVPRPHVDRYGISKCGDWLLGVEYGRRHQGDGIVSAPINPGNVRTQLARDQTIGLKIVAHAIVYPIIKGVYTQLFAAFSPDVTPNKVDWTKFWS
jgi:retinol dehydrogenase-12